MKTIATLIAVATTALVATVGMAQEPQQRFTHDGSTYVYTTFAKNNGRTVISGRRYPAGTPFRLVVRNDYVTGVSDGRPVSFKRVAATGAATVLAAN